MDLSMIDTGVTEWYTLKGAEPGDDTAPRFELRPLTGRQRYDVRSSLEYSAEGAVTFSPTALDKALRYALVGWENFPARWVSGNPGANLDALPEEVYVELGAHVILVGLVGADAGNA